MQRAAWAILVVTVSAACASSAQSESGFSSSSGGARACTEAVDCARGQLCHDGLCGDPECSTRSDCGNTRTCRSGACVAPDPLGFCDVEDDCVEPYICDGIVNRCFDTATGRYFGDGADAGMTSSSGGADGGIPLGGWRLVNEESSANEVGPVPAAVRVRPGTIIVMGRSSGRADFEAAWGVTLGDDVVFTNSSDPFTDFPVVNGAEVLTLRNPQDQVVDGPTIAGTMGTAVQRVTTSSASDPASWRVVADAQATPGATLLSVDNHGFFISEWSDSTSTMGSAFEFVELFYNP